MNMIFFKIKTSNAKQVKNSEWLDTRNTNVTFFLIKSEINSKITEHMHNTEHKSL